MESLKEFKFRRDLNHNYRDRLRAASLQGWHALQQVKELYKKLYGDDLTGLDHAMDQLSLIHHKNKAAMETQPRRRNHD